MYKGTNRVRSLTFVSKMYVNEIRKINLFLFLAKCSFCIQKAHVVDKNIIHFEIACLERAILSADFEIACLSNNEEIHIRTYELS